MTCINHNGPEDIADRARVRTARLRQGIERRIERLLLKQLRAEEELARQGLKRRRRRRTPKLRKADTPRVGKADAPKLSKADTPKVRKAERSSRTP